MATLKIGDKRVTVGDEFLSLPPDQQQATVDEIAQSLSATPKAERQAIGAMLPDAPVGPQSLNWSDVPQKALQNTPESAKKFAQDMVQPILHPVQTAQSLSDLVTGTLENFVPVNDVLRKVGLGRDEKTVAKERDVSSAVGQYFVDRYGSAEGFKKALATDPVGVAGDLASVFTGGEMLAAKTLGNTSRVTRALGTAGEITNPLFVPAKGLEVAGKATGAGVKTILGTTTGTSGDTISQAYQAGRKGGEQKQAFTRNLRGHEDQAVVIDEAKRAVGNIADARRKQYETDMQSVKQSGQKLDFAPVENAFQTIVDSMFHNGHQKVSDQTINKLKEIGDVLDEWSADPGLHTPSGFDALKQRVDDLMPSFTEAGNAERAVTATRNAIKKIIVDAAPEYGKAMQGYEKSKTAQREIEKSLSLGRNASADTTLRKLQSLTRNNVNTNYGSRVNSAKVLEDAGATTLMPSLAGQALNTLMPRGLMGQALGAGALVGGQLLNPLFLAGLPLSSPRLVGEAANLAGSASRKLSRLPKPTKAQLLWLRNLGNASLLGQE